MIRMLSVALAVSLFAAPVLAAEAPKEAVVLKSAKQGDITFKHETHKAVKCEVCHGTAEGGKIAGLDMKKGHAVCQDCHKKQENKALAKCDNCHKKAPK